MRIRLKSRAAEKVTHMDMTLADEHKAASSRHRLTVADFHKMGEAGILDQGVRVELLEGEIIDMPPIGSLHAGVVKRLIRVLTTAISNAAIVDAQNPVVLDEHSEPQPDIAVLKPRDDFYTKAHPGPEDVLLLVEVADSSAHYDRSVKIPLYARANITEVWLVDLPQKRLEVYRLPQPEHADYQRIEHCRDGKVAPEKLPDAVIDVTSLFIL
jgi:Uma2 family endonuclease